MEKCVKLSLPYYGMLTEIESFVNEKRQEGVDLFSLERRILRALDRGIQNYESLERINSVKAFPLTDVYSQRAL